MIEKTFAPRAVEERIYRAWERSGAFRAGQRPQAQPFCIMIPPPNVTGRLHIGHALNNTLQDVLARFERMRGKDVLWQPGTDHAGISTQLVVERNLAERQQSRIAMGRELFLKEVWKWKEESGGAIVQQLRRLGASCDWSREQFTLDEGLSRAVARVFVQLYREGLIYKDKRLVNWDPRLQTAVSDLEVENIDIKGNLWYIRYPIEDEPGRFIVIATTRPETMLGDVAVAVHPEDERYRELVGKFVRLPFAGRRIPIIADEYSDPEKGTGAVKITPAHDFNDFDVGRRHGLPLINILERDGRLNDSVPAAYRGLDRFAARKCVLADLEALDLIERTEPIVHAVPHDEKTKTVALEPYLTEQWYLDVCPLAEKAIRAVEAERTRFVPEQWRGVYFNWLRNIHPWCISRQLWWGHQLPVWYGPSISFEPDISGMESILLKGSRFDLGLSIHLFVAETEEEAIEQARWYYKQRQYKDFRISIANTVDEGIAALSPYFEGSDEVKIWRDPDVLDTWFSSALWPFSTLGWPEDTPELKRYYPTNVLVTSFDIIFFWVARMMMTGLHFMDDVPFRTVFIHTRVLDEKGQKMSKTKGNVVDPLVLIDEFGADALRFTLAIAAGQGRDMRIGPARVEANRNFTTKLWNAARFCEMNGCETRDGFDPARVGMTVNKWIVSETASAARDITQGIEQLRFNEAAQAAYQFVWSRFCDWYLELVKPVLAGGNEKEREETRATAAWARDQIFKLLHPFMPFVTEELWNITAPRASMLVVAEWPGIEPAGNAEACAEIAWLIELVSGIRSIRTEMNVPAGARIDLVLSGTTAEMTARLMRNREALLTLARLSSATVADSIPVGSAQFVVGEATAALPLGNVIDLDKERARLEKEIQRAESEVAKLDAKLVNADFVARAPEEIIDEQKQRRADADALASRLRAAVRRLG